MKKLQVKTFLGIDYGEKRIGLAIGNDAEKVARPFKIIHKFFMCNQNQKINGKFMGIRVEHHIKLGIKVSIKAITIL